MNGQQTSERAGTFPPTPTLSKRPCLYKYFSEERWADAFLQVRLQVQLVIVFSRR